MVADSGLDATPCVAWSGCEVRRYRNDLYALKPLSQHDAKQVLVWADLEQDLYISSLDLYLSKTLLAKDLKQQASTIQVQITVRFRQGGERLIRQKGYALELKTLFQAAGVPPWERERIPLVYLGEDLRLVVGVYPAL